MKRRVNVSPSGSPLIVDREVLEQLRRRQLRLDDGARSWGGLTFEATLDVAKFIERRQ